LESLGDSIEDMTAAKQGEKLLKILSKFSSGLTDFVDGKGSPTPPPFFHSVG
jgi:hypothetical protein